MYYSFTDWNIMCFTALHDDDDVDRVISQQRWLAMEIRNEMEILYLQNDKTAQAQAFVDAAGLR